jgi:HK97 family phage major capsid protein
MATKLQEKQGELEAKAKALHEIFEKYPDMNMPEDVAKSIKPMNDELTDLGKEVDSLKALEQISRNAQQILEDGGSRQPSSMSWQKGQNQAGEREVKSLGDRIVESKAFKEYQKGSGQGPADEIEAKELFERKTVFDSSTGFAPQAVRTGVVVDYALQRPMVTDLIPVGETNQNAIVYMEETTSTNNAAETAEKSDSPESALAFTQKDSSVRDIRTYLPVTEIALEDAPGMASIINNRLGLFIRMRRETQIISGDGNAPNLRGLMNIVGKQTQAKGADPTPDAFYKAMTLVMTGSYLDPSGIVIHPSDWEPIRLLRTNDGVYIWGSPSEAGPERMWGLPVIKTTAMTQNTGLVAAFDTAMQLFFKKMINIQISNSHSDYFIKGQLAVRANERVALVVYRPAAICTVTGI